jgi:hypothetical protein
MTHHRNVNGWERIKVIVLVLAAIGAPQSAFCLDDTYLHCKGAIEFVYESGVQSEVKQEIAAHVLQGRVSFTGNKFLSGTDIEICRFTDDMYFDSQSCKEDRVVDLSRPRQYGTLNKITGELHLSSEGPKRRFAQGSFTCKKLEPLMK